MAEHDLRKQVADWDRRAGGGSRQAQCAGQEPKDRWFGGRFDEQLRVAQLPATLATLLREAFAGLLQRSVVAPHHDQRLGKVVDRVIEEEWIRPLPRRRG